ncbi:hypothetical protein QYE76_027308 [Lolium multiflorum]|uniref:Uncharacterized protein n=1 Tax=Lolium multiflorum TaxID=4521 RepID=A0AAD8VG88_LOLMU|nr:hypothetical protein QYE76_027308 [Lolium multiflorum]
MPIVTELAVLSGEAGAEEADHVEEVPVSIDWNTVDISDRTDLVIAPMSDIQMATMFGIPVDEKDKEKEKDEAADDGNRQSRTVAFDADIDSELMHDAAVEVGDGHLICVYDKEKPVIEVVLEEQGPVLEDVQIDAGLEDVQIDGGLDDVQIDVVLEDVQTEAVFEDVQIEDLLDQVETDDVLDQMQTEAALEHVVQPEIPPPSRDVCLGRPTESGAKKKKEHECYSWRCTANRSDFDSPKEESTAVYVHNPDGSGFFIPPTEKWWEDQELREAREEAREARWDAAKKKRAEAEARREREAHREARFREDRYVAISTAQMAARREDWIAAGWLP